MNKELGIIKKLKIMVQNEISSNVIPDDVLSCMIRTQTYIRTRELNRANQQKTIKQNYKNNKIKKNCNVEFVNINKIIVNLNENLVI